MRLTTAISVALATISTATAQTERDLDSHDHGHAFLNIAFEGNNTFIELESPWNNLVGFEHAPSTDEQQAKVDEAIALLNRPGDLFTFNGTDCIVSETMIESTLAEGDDHDDEHHDDHADGHDDEHHDEHADGHDDEHHDEHDHDADGETHSQVLASYTFECSNGPDLLSIQVGLFDKMSGFEEVDVQIIGPGGQDATELTAEQFTIDLSKVQ